MITSNVFDWRGWKFQDRAEHGTSPDITGMSTREDETGLARLHEVIMNNSLINSQGVKRDMGLI